MFKKDEVVFDVSKDKETPIPPTNLITITIETDEGYTFKDTGKSCTIEVEKNTTWASIKAKAEDKIELKDGYKKKGWKLGGKDGSYLEDSTVFNENAFIFATSKKKGELEKPKITITVKGDDGVEVGSPDNFSVDSGSKWAEIKAQAVVIAKVSLADGWSAQDYCFYDWRIGGEKGDEMLDSTQIRDDIVVYARTNYKRLERGGYRGEKPRGRIFLPKKFIGIDHYGFRDCAGLTDVDLSDCTDIIWIGRQALKNCSSLESIDLSWCILDKIDIGVFSGCSKLKSVVLASYYSDIKKIEMSAFSGCTKAVVKLPVSITEIDRGAFGGDNDSYCKKVLVPNSEIKKLIIGLDYPEDRIGYYQ